MTDPNPPRARRPRRSCLSVPGVSTRYLDKARGLPADHVFLDLEDSVPADHKTQARARVIAALRAGGWQDKTVSVRVNEPLSPWAAHDVIDVVEQAGSRLDAIMLPKTEEPAHLHWLDILLTQLERAEGLAPGRIAIEAHVETARGVLAAPAIAAACGRTEAIVFGSGDYSASVGMAHAEVGEPPPGYPADAFHQPLTTILLAARAHGLQAVDGAYFRIHDAAGFDRAAQASAALGFDGKVVLHPAQIEAANRVYVPTQAQYEHAELVLEAHEYCSRELGLGAAMLGSQMIDEATRRVASMVVAKGRAAGLPRSRAFDPATDLSRYARAGVRARDNGHRPDGDREAAAGA
ncbi:CoA ester lyase [Streptomyces sp. NPDC051940]|uniref:HpcH/HpaI aldolase/citrate lyase family protein n=1 Tax=Streptomyces sp. NPDC051940 TaxID=3155675 RepID=UPI00344A6F24